MVDPNFCKLHFVHFHIPLIDPDFSERVTFGILLYTMQDSVCMMFITICHCFAELANFRSNASKIYIAFRNHVQYSIPLYQYRIPVQYTFASQIFCTQNYWQGTVAIISLYGYCPRFFYLTSPLYPTATDPDDMSIPHRPTATDLGSCEQNLLYLQPFQPKGQSCQAFLPVTSSDFLKTQTVTSCHGSHP